MSTLQSQDSRFQNQNRIRRLTLGFGVMQTIVGLALTALSFITFFFTEADRIRSSCPYWAGLTVCCSGGVGIIAWRRSSMLSMGLFTFFSSVCVVLQMIGTIFTGDVGGILNSVIMCNRVIGSDVCVCCDTIASCQQESLVYRFEGISDCSIINGLLKELVFGLCVLNIFGIVLCFSATVLGCTAFIQCTGRDQILFRRHNSERSTTVTEDPSTWLPYSRDLDPVLAYAPPVYHSVDNLQEFGTTPYIVPPPVFDPTDLPPPYSSGNPSLSNSHCSLGYRDCSVYSCQHSRRESYRTSLYTHHSACSAQTQASDLSSREEFLQTQISLRDNVLGSCNASICSQPLERDVSITCTEEGASVDQAEDILQEEFVGDTGNNTSSAVSTTDSDAGSRKGSVRSVSCGDPANISKELINLSDSQNVCHSGECTSRISPVNRDLSTAPPNLSLGDYEGVPMRRLYSACEGDRSLYLKHVTPQQLHPPDLNLDIVRTSPNTSTALHASELIDDSLCSRHAIKERSTCGTPDVKCRKIESSGRENQLSTSPQGEFSGDKNEHQQSGQIRRPVSMGKTKTALYCSKETIV